LFKLALIAPKRTFTKWGDVINISNYWAEHVAIVLLKKGVRPKEGAPKPPKGYIGEQAPPDL
jgi:hypothetical protein